MPRVSKNGFLFGGVDSVAAWGLCVNSYDFFLPPKRARKIVIPGRNGSYDYGAKFFDERALRLECTLTRRMKKSDFRAVIYALSQKKQLRLWDEPDKYYIGELYGGEEVSVYPLEMMREFSLSFTCEPFAYSDAAETPISGGVNPIRYTGTAEAPTVIEIVNPNAYPVSNLSITAVRRRK